VKRYFILGLIGVFGAIVVVLSVEAYRVLVAVVAPMIAPPASTTEEHESYVLSRKLKPLPDVDALAARIPFEQDAYRQVRDAALAGYAIQHPGVHLTDAEARETLKLVAYLVIWDDFYGEGLWQAAIDHAKHIAEAGNHDPLWDAIYSAYLMEDRYSSDQSGVLELNGQQEAVGREAYPPAFKLWAYQVAIHNVEQCKEEAELHPGEGAQNFDSLPRLVDEAVDCYRQMIKQHASHVYLYRAAVGLMGEVKDNEPILKQTSTGFDKAFQAEDRDNPQADVLDGEFYVDDAWNARGSGYANTVTTQGWQNFRDRLASANRILNDVYARYPQEPGAAYSMMDVVLGQEETRDQMELWFQRGLQVEGNHFRLCMAKRWYLLPRWYGSDAEVFAFGLECAKSTNWADKIPMLLIECISDRADREPGVYADPEIWTPVEKVYRDYLSHYPDSTHYRSLFTLAAAQGGHWDVVKEQLKILGDDWDPKVFTDSLYPDTVRQAQAH